MYRLISAVAIARCPLTAMMMMMVVMVCFGDSLLHTITNRGYWGDLTPSYFLCIWNTNKCDEVIHNDYWRVCAKISSKFDFLVELQLYSENKIKYLQSPLYGRTAGIVFRE